MPIPLPALDVRGAQQQEGPLQQYAQLLGLKSQLNQQKIQQQALQQGQMQTQQMRTQMNEHDAVRQAIANANGDIRSAIPEIMKVSPNTGMQMQKELSEWDSADIKKKQEILTLKEKQTARMGQLAGAVNDEQSKNTAVNTALQEGLIDRSTAQSYLQKPYDPNWIKGLQQQALTAQQQIQQANEQLKQQEIERHNKATEENQRKNPTEASLAVQAAAGDPKAKAALSVLAEQKKAGRTVVNALGSSANDPKDIAAAIIRGEQPPTLTGLYRNAAPVRAELARKGFNLQQAESDWKAVQKHLATLNGAQQERLRQAVTFTSDSLDNIEDLYSKWKKLGPNSGLKILNKAALATAKQLPGEAGSVAQNLEAQINDLVSELGTVYKGGNASTDETLRLAAENLKADWNEATFNRAIQQIRKNLAIRKNSILTSEPVGVSDNSPYNPKSSSGGGDPLGIR